MRLVKRQIIYNIQDRVQKQSAFQVHAQLKYRILCQSYDQKADLVINANFIFFQRKYNENILNIINKFTSIWM